MMVKANREHAELSEVDVNMYSRLISESAAKLSEGEEFQTLIDSVTEAREVEKVSAAPMYMLLTSKFSNEELDSFPVPGSDQAAGHNNPDKYVEFDENNRTKNGEARKVNRSFWDSVFDATPVGKVYNREIQQLTLASSQTPGEADPAYIDMPQDVRKSLLTKYNNRRSYGRKVLKDGYRIYLQLQAINKELRNKVAASIITDADDNLVMSAACIWIEDKTKKGQGIALTIATFLALDVEKASVNGGNYTALIQTARKKKPNGVDAGGKTVPAIDTSDKAIQYIAELSAYLSDPTDRTATARRQNIIRREMLDKNDDALIMSLGRLYDALDPLYDDIAVRYNELKEAEKEANRSAA